MDSQASGKPTILAVDDDPSITSLISEVLTSNGMDVVVCNSGAEALSLLADRTFDLALLDVMMPGMDGFELCTSIRSFSDMPIMFLTARDSEGELVIGLSLGADDYLTKPFRPRELVARIRTRLRKTSTGAEDVTSLPDELVTRDFDINRRTHAVRLNGTPLDLTPKEFAILVMLAENAGAPVSANELYENVWHDEYDTGASNTVMVHIRHLRQKCAEVDDSQTYIETMWGIGYRIRGGGR